MENIPFYYQPSGNNYVTNPLQGGQVVQITFPSSDPVQVSIDTRLSSAQPWSVMTPVQVTGSQVIRLLRHAVGQQFRLRCRIRPSDCQGSPDELVHEVEELSQRVSDLENGADTLAQRVTDLEEGNEPLLLYLEPDSGYLMQEGVSSGEFHINYETGYLEFES